MTTARVLLERFIAHYGFPTKLHTDQGCQFEGRFIYELFKLNDTRKSRIAPCHLMGNISEECLIFDFASLPLEIARRI